MENQELFLTRLTQIWGCNHDVGVIHELPLHLWIAIAHSPININFSQMVRAFQYTHL